MSILKGEPSTRELLAKRAQTTGGLSTVGKQVGAIWKYSITYSQTQNKLGENKIKDSKFFGDSYMFAALTGTSGSYFLISLQHQHKYLIDNSGPIYHYQVLYPWVVTLHQCSSQEFELVVVNIDSNDQKRSKITSELELTNFAIIENSMINTTKNGFRLFNLFNLSIEAYLFECGSVIDFPIGDIYNSGNGHIVVQSREKNQFFVYDIKNRSKLFQDFFSTPMTFVHAHNTDLFVVYNLKKLLFRSFSESYTQENKEKMIVINLNFAIATVLLHENTIYIADLSSNIYVYDSSAQLLFNFSLSELMDGNMLTSVISKLMVVNDNCLIVNTCIIGPSGGHSSSVLNLFFNNSLLGGESPKPVYQLQAKTHFGNSEIKKVECIDDVIYMSNDQLVVSWLVQKERVDKEFLVLTYNNEFFGKVFYNRKFISVFAASFTEDTEYSTLITTLMLMVHGGIDTLYHFFISLMEADLAASDLKYSKRSQEYLRYSQSSDAGILPSMVASVDKFYFALQAFSPFMKIVKAFLTLTGGVFFEVYLRPEFQKALDYLETANIEYESTHEELKKMVEIIHDVIISHLDQVNPLIRHLCFVITKVVKDHYPEASAQTVLNQLISPIILDRYIIRCFNSPQLYFPFPNGIKKAQRIGFTYMARTLSRATQAYAGLRFDTIENVRILPPVLVLKAKQLAKSKALEKWVSNIPQKASEKKLSTFIKQILVQQRGGRDEMEREISEYVCLNYYLLFGKLEWEQLVDPFAPVDPATKEMKEILSKFCLSNKHILLNRSSSVPTKDLFLAHFLTSNNQYQQQFGKLQENEIQYFHPALNISKFVSLRKWMNEEAKLHSFTIVIFYRSQLDAYCREYLLAYQKLVEKINHYRGFIFGVSTDINNSLFEVMGNDQKITLISDVDLNIINQFGTEVYVTVKNEGEIAMVQPAVLILNGNNEIVYFWKSDVSAGAFYGATQRPQPEFILETAIRNTMNMSKNEILLKDVQFIEPEDSLFVSDDKDALVEKFTFDCWNGNLREVKKMLKHPDIHSFILKVNERGQNGLYCAAHNGHVDIVVCLLNFYSTSEFSLNDVNLRMGEFESTALHAASFNKRDVVVALLLAHGAAPNVPNKAGLGPRQEASGLALDCYIDFERGGVAFLRDKYPIVNKLISRSRLNSRQLPSQSSDANNEGVYDYCAIDSARVDDGNPMPLINFPPRDRPSNDGEKASSHSLLSSSDSGPSNAVQPSSPPNNNAATGVPHMPSLSMSYPADTYHIPNSPRVMPRQSMSNSQGNLAYPNNAQSPRLVPLKRVATEVVRENRDAHAPESVASPRTVEFMSDLEKLEKELDEDFDFTPDVQQAEKPKDPLMPRMIRRGPPSVRLVGDEESSGGSDNNSPPIQPALNENNNKPMHVPHAKHSASSGDLSKFQVHPANSLSPRNNPALRRALTGDNKEPGAGSNVIVSHNNNSGNNNSSHQPPQQVNQSNQANQNANQNQNAQSLSQSNSSQQSPVSPQPAKKTKEEVEMNILVFLFSQTIEVYLPTLKRWNEELSKLVGEDAVIRLPEFKQKASIFKEACTLLNSIIKVPLDLPQEVPEKRSELLILFRQYSSIFEYCLPVLKTESPKQIIKMGIAYKKINSELKNLPEF